MTHTVAILIYPEFELLDASGPSSVFGAANMMLGQDGKPAFYAIETVSPRGGAVRSNCGVALHARALSRFPAKGVDTLLVTGALEPAMRAAWAEASMRRWVPICAASAERLGSICAGIFILAGLGLVTSGRVATHWDACAPLAERFPALTVDPDSIYVEEGRVWTSAGVTAGIDMALAMVARDLGAAMAARVAQWLVLYARRPGHQSQFSPILKAQVKADNPFAELIDWMNAHLDGPLEVEALAARAGLSERSFYRKFLAVTGVSPARFVETLRLEAARMLLAQNLSLKVIAARTGLSPAARLTAAFERRFGVTPRLFREMHAPDAPPANH